MRMPEPDHGHYASDILNYGYVYTNLDDIVVQEDMARNYITIYTSERKADYKPINLVSYYSIRHREKTRLAPLFIGVFLKEAEKYKLKEKIDINARKLDQKIISDWAADNIDSLVGQSIIADKLITATSEDLQRFFDYFVRQYLTPYYPEDRSVGRVKESIYRFFEQELDMDYGEKGEEIIQIALSDKNIHHFINVIDVSKKVYQEETARIEPELGFVEDWNVPETIRYNENYHQIDCKKSIVKPFHSDDKWQTEKSFIEFLENASNSVAWWFKNGDRDATFFAVPYDNGEQRPFYVDFIVKLKDGRIGLFDTKTGLTLQVAGAKIDGLCKYLKDENKKDKNLFGGIVTNTDQGNYRGRWIYFDKFSKELKNNDSSNWTTLEF